MRHFFIIGFSILFGIVGCQSRHDYPQTLREIDSIAYENPDSALVRLQKLENGIWFRDEKYLSEIYFITAKAHRNRQDIPAALDYFERTISRINYMEDVAEKRAVYTQAGDLFFSETLYDESRKAYSNAYICDVALKDTSSILKDLRDVAIAYRYQHQDKDALVYYQKARDIAEQARDTLLRNLMISQIASIQTKLGRTDEAMKAIESLLAYLDSTNIVSLYATAADVYYKTAQFGAASYYYESLLKLGNIYDKREAYGKLASIEALDGQHEEALCHLAQYVYLNDSINLMMANEQKARMNALYNYHVKEQEKTELAIKQKELQIKLLISITTIIIISMIFVYFIIRSRAKRLELELDLQRFAKVQDELYRTSAQVLAESNRKIEALEAKLATLSVEDKVEKERIKQEKKKLENSKKLIEEEVSKHKETDKLLENSALCQHLHQKAKQKKKAISTDEWSEAVALLESIYPEFIDTLERMLELNPTERQICYLLKLQFAPSEIAALISQSTASVSMARKRLYNKHFQEEGTPTEWDFFIRSL